MIGATDARVDPALNDSSTIAEAGERDEFARQLDHDVLFVGSQPRAVEQPQLEVIDRVNAKQLRDGLVAVLRQVDLGRTAQAAEPAVEQRG